MRLRLLPRALHVPSPVTPGDLWPPAASRALIDNLPDDIRSMTGEIRHVSYPGQGRCNLLLRLDADNGYFVLKAARGPYRGQELWAEHVMMQDLSATSIPVPNSLAFIQDQELYLQLRPYVRGTPVNALLEDPRSKVSDLKVMRRVGQILSMIHALDSSNWTWDQWLDASLAVAEQNLCSGVIDPDEFSADEPAPSVLDWLQTTRPPAGTICLIHGDYRTKNLLWRIDRIVSVLDWAFADFGDPYYDLAVMLGAIQDRAAINFFITGYGIKELDSDRLYYFHQLSKFLNV